ncbi:MAG: tyrosine-type recombinase/integrase [Deltaproteobacteria bacterium]|nr:tyrosine-type recombinase/integrase [Deltaproteobacteria bacterium]
MFRDEIGLDGLSAGAVGPHIAGFTHHLDGLGYARFTIERRVKAAAHLGLWLERNGLEVDRLSEHALDLFGHHLPRCQCPDAVLKARRAAMTGARLFVKYVCGTGVLGSMSLDETHQCIPPLIAAFRHWMLEHRGVKSGTLDRYGRTIEDLLRTLGEDPEQFTVSALRRFVVELGQLHSRGQAQNVATAVRSFLRYLVATGQCAIEVEGAIPPVASWRLSTLPRYLPTSDVKRILDTCQTDTSIGLRDRAILLLLSWLGLRAGEVVGLCLGDIDWEQASFVVAGKGRIDRLPLPQEVGDAILKYLEHGRPNAPSDRLFLRARAPHLPFAKSAAVSSIVGRAIRRAGVDAPSHGAHVLRHSAATRMLREGNSLQSIGKILRHRCLESTALYAKVDVTLLNQIAQPWPELTSC